jgi:hypothetical protein
MNLKAVSLGFLLLSSFMSAGAQSSRAAAKIENAQLVVETNWLGDTYTLRSKEKQRGAMSGRVAAQIDHRWISSGSYPHHEVKEASFAEGLDAGPQLTVTHSGRSGDPDLICQIRLHSRPAFAEIEVQVRNSTGAPTTVQSIRVLESVEPFVNLDGLGSRIVRQFQRRHGNS